MSDAIVDVTAILARGRFNRNLSTEDLARQVLDTAKASAASARANARAKMLKPAPTEEKAKDV
jgi:hypothetical protein